jgi:hypothetical protein
MVGVKRGLVDGLGMRMKTKKHGGEVRNNHK